jgi:ornithine cyclodeaminase/alanine dehydrogenase-like protein (mu-crystallin family)
LPEFDMLTLDCDILAKALGFGRLIEALRRGHIDGVDLVERALLTEPGTAGAPPNHLLVWPAWRFGGHAGVKMVSVFPANPDVGKPTNATVYVLFDGRDGRPLATLTGAALTTMKTAADSALAADHLARRDARVLAVLGAGAQAPWQVAALRTVRPTLDHVLVWNRNAARAEALAAQLRADFAVSAETVADASVAVAAADIVTAVTGSTVPIIEGARLRPGTHVDLVGGFTAAMREADDETIRRGRLWVDTRRFTLADCGDVAGPIAAGVIGPQDIVGDLFELCRGTVPGRRDASEITVYKNAGGGHLDLMTAIAFYEWASANAAAP